MFLLNNKLNNIFQLIIYFANGHSKLVNKGLLFFVSLSQVSENTA